MENGICFFLNPKNSKLFAKKLRIGLKFPKNEKHYSKIHNA